MWGETKRIWYNPATRKYVVTGLGGAVRTNLVCDAETGVVYFKFGGTGCESYMSPYIGPNGKFCKLVANQIVEIG